MIRIIIRGENGTGLQLEALTVADLAAAIDKLQTKSESLREIVAAAKEVTVPVPLTG